MLIIKVWYSHLWILIIVLGRFGIKYAETTWTLSTTSSIQLLALFPDPENTSQPTELSVHPRAMFKAALVLAQQYNITIDGQFIGGYMAQTGGSAIGAVSSVCQAITTSNILGIVGPAFSREASIIAAFAHEGNIPAISYSATNPGLSDRNAYPNFFRTVASDAMVGIAMVKLFTRYNWTSCIIIYQNDEFGSGGAEVISKAFRENNLIVSELIVFDIATKSIRRNLKDLPSTTATRIVIVWADNNLTTLILKAALKADVLGPDFTWILSTRISFSAFDQTLYSNLAGMLILEPVIGSVVNAPFNSILLNAAYKIWQQYEAETFPGPDKVSYYSLFAFDAAWTLIQALQKMCSSSTLHSFPCVSFDNKGSCFDRRFKNFTSFFNQISNTGFLGVSGAVKFDVNTTDRIDGLYYITTNVQPSSNGIQLVPVLQWSYSDNWQTYTQANMIIWPGNKSAPPTGFAGLNGVKLRICVMISIPFTMLPGTMEQNQTKLIGYLPDVIAILQARMGFIPDIVYPSANQTYSGLVQAVVNSLCDVVVADLTVTAKRRDIVDFSTPIFDNSMRVITRQTTNTDFDLFSFIKPFSMTLWLILFFCILYAAALFYVLERYDNEALQERSFISSVAMSIWFSIGTVMGYGADFHAQTAAGRLLSVGLYLLSLVLVATYTANLASDLTISKSKNSISGIDDIKNGKIPFMRIGILVDSSQEEYYMREISGGVRNYYPLATQAELYRSLLNNLIDVSILDTGAVEYFTSNIYCNLTLVGTDFAPNSYGIAYRKQWLYGKDLDIIILSLRESGVLDALKKKWFDKNVCQDSSSSSVSTRVSIEEMSGLMFTFGIISFVSLVLFIRKKRFVVTRYPANTTLQNSSVPQQQINEGKCSIETLSTFAQDSQASSLRNTTI